MKNTCMISAAFVTAVLNTLSAAADEPYQPVINPEDFTTNITNPLFNMPVGKKMTYESKTDEGVERIEIVIPGKTKVLMGVTTLLHRDIVILNGEVIEDTRDYIAQHKDGSVWYFGEEVDNYEGGKLKDHHGSWFAGVENAMPGIWMKAKQVAGDSYRQEYYKGEAEDWAKVVSTNETVTVPAGTFNNCTKTLEWTPLEPDNKAYKYNCPEAGGIALEEELKDGSRVELVKIDKAS
jgi:hypothetical protein